MLADDMGCQDQQLVDERNTICDSTTMCCGRSRCIKTIGGVLLTNKDMCDGDVTTVPQDVYGIQPVTWVCIKSGMSKNLSQTRKPLLVAAHSYECAPPL